jgi:hypothetical protein
MKIIFKEISQMDGVNVMPRMPIFYQLTRKIVHNYRQNYYQNCRIWNDTMCAPFYNVDLLNFVRHYRIEHSGSSKV